MLDRYEIEQLIRNEETNGNINKARKRKLDGDLEALDMAERVRSQYEAYLTVGFTEEESLELTKIFASKFIDRRY